MNTADDCVEHPLLAGKRIHPVGIGTWAMGGAFLEDRSPYADYDHDDADVRAIVHAIGRGQNHIDTAQMYGAGHAQEIVAEAVRHAGVDRDNLFIASKVWKSHLRRSAVPRAVEDMLIRLNTSYLDLLYVHYPWDIVPMNDYIAGLNDVLESGMTRSIGVSNFSLDQLREAVALSRNPIVANQIHFSLLERRIASSELLRYCRENGIVVVAWKPLERGSLADRKTSGTLAALSDTYNRPPSQISLNWLIGREGVLAIPKATNPKYIDENVGAADFRLSAGDRCRLDELPEQLGK